MRKGVALITAVALGFMAGTAAAAGLSGPIEDIDPVSGTIVVAGEVFSVTSKTVGPKLEQLKQGDNVEVVYLPMIGADDTFEAMLIRRKGRLR